ncbi:acetyl/propionyl/methylcrotonyl-CoA carboxylase subunit alpha [Polaromonas sp.]|uniref:acetyl/propionyl/methylcrotonyl-CoA carboxylase subunit alpha n=1 Tax=Polaromonas sp. TaxID=1869339 RepID=UPI002FC68F8B
MRRLLIANRGEIARRIIRTAQRLGLETVAVYSDADAQALHVREATRSFALGGKASAESYLCIDKLIAAARVTGADAVHPGYGFLSENADFAQAVQGAGLTWVGPPPTAIRTLGSKNSVKQLAQSRGVPCLSGYHGDDQSDQRFADEAQRIGFPVMVKAAAGGGGRGMRLVSEAGQLLEAVHSARSEAQAAFGSGELLLERALLNPRHVEVQVFADSLGHCIHLGERDCSVQRRHQKIIEETPSPAVDAALRERMGRCAVELAQAAGYVGAGTVEFLLEASPHPSPLPAGEGANFYLMEMNTRLQVEHPVTEAVTGLDLVEWQLRVAQGEPLPLNQEQVQFKGHAIEVRLCAEDEHFTPHAGTVLRFREPGGVRFDHALFDGLQVPSYYDSMLGKLVAHAATRGEAIDQLAAALDRTEVLGLPTNRRFLAACLRHPEFRAGQALIPFLAGQGDAVRELLQKEELLAQIPCGLAAIFSQENGRNQALMALPCPFPRPVRLRHRGEQVDVTVSGVPDLPRGVSVVRMDGRRWHVQHHGVDLFIEDASFEPAAGAAAATANELRAPFNGMVIAVKAAAGGAVSKGDTLLVIESMKLEHALAASRDGIVRSVHVAPGQQAATSQVLVTFEALA